MKDTTRRGADKGAFAQILTGLMAERDIGVRALDRLTARAGRRYSHSYISALTRGELEPTVENMEVIARALNVDPLRFREYRQHLAAERAAELAGELELDVVLDALNGLNGGAPDAKQASMRTRKQHS